MTISKRELRSYRELFELGYTYLLENFHKFSEGNKIKIALEVYKKQMPTKMEHDFQGSAKYQQKLLEKLGLTPKVEEDADRPEASE